MMTSFVREHGNPLRAFVIPVLDYSPASEYNILTLLNDLESIAGEVIVIFNGAQVGEELKSHPRITRYALMKQNVGVARAWNIGIQMAEAETVHILNADAHILASAVEALEAGLQSLDRAVCVGPQGAFVNFVTCKDYHYFDRGSFDRPIQVDAVSGFFFAVNRQRMAKHGLMFETGYTPCYFEEWDFGLQSKQAGLACWIVPTTAYDHHWSGTISALRTIPYMGREETAEDILSRNRGLFLEKWRSVEMAVGSALVTSNYKDYLRQQILHDIENGLMSGAQECIDNLTQSYPDDEESTFFARYMQLALSKQQYKKLPVIEESA